MLAAEIGWKRSEWRYILQVELRGFPAPVVRGWEEGFRDDSRSSALGAGRTELPTDVGGDCEGAGLYVFSRHIEFEMPTGLQV